MELIKIIKNVSGNKLSFLKKDIDNNEEYEIPSNLWLELIGNQDIYDKVENSQIIVSDGTSYLSIEKAIDHLNKTQVDILNFPKRYVVEEIVIRQEEEMILSDFTDIEENGCLDINGILTILGE